MEDERIGSETEAAAVPEVAPLVGDIEVLGEKPRFEPDICDFIFALAVFALGYMYSRWVFLGGLGWGVSAFTTAFLVSVWVYLIRKGHPAKNTAAWFWTVITWLTGLSFALWDGLGLEPVRTLFLFCAAVYFVITAAGRTLMGKTGNFLLLDGLNTVLLIPFRNFLNQYISFSALRRGHKKRLPVLLGVLLALFMIIWLIPLLRSADSGGFNKILDAVTGILKLEDMREFLICAAFSVPVSAYMFGLVSGAAHGRGTDTIKPEGAVRAVGALRVLQPVTVYIALWSVFALYAVFILCQIPYFFSAFTGVRPDGFLIYSEYARHGFFELCGIAAINLAVITACNAACAMPRCQSRMLKAINIALALITLLLIATAFSKMALYIGVYGLSMPRLLPCVFMLFLGIVFIALILLQWQKFSIVRFALVTGAVMLCVLTLINPDAIVVRYNTGRYLAGTLTDYDTDILFRAGSAGVTPALEVYEYTDDAGKLMLKGYLEALKNECTYYAGTHKMSYERYIASVRLGELNE